MKKRVNQGKSFETVIDVEDDEKGRRRYRFSLCARDVIALVIVFLTAISLIIAFAVGVIDGSYNELGRSDKLTI